MMSLRKVNPRVIVECKIMAVQAGITAITSQELECTTSPAETSGGACKP